jgi:LysR family hydrogen peroxide-inducible transcriptional activator
MSRLSLRQLEYLAAIEDTGSFSLAAEKCLVTQSTLSAGIKELETILGQKLIERGPRGAALTPFGRRAAESARKIFAETDDLLARSKSLSAPLSGPLRLGVIPTVAPYLLPRILPGLQKKFPALELQLHEDMTGRLLEELRRGQLDAVLMAFPFDTPGMTQKILFRENFLVACPKDYAHPRAFQARDLDREKLLLLEDGHCLRDHALLACDIRRPQFSQNRAFSATSLPTLIQMVGHGFGITLLPEMAARAGSLPAGLELIPFSAPAPGRDIGLAWMRGHPKTRDFELLSTAIEKLQKPGKRLIKPA